MSQDEVAAIYKVRNEADKMRWEQIRLQCFYSVIAMNGTKTFKKPSDLFGFEWDKKKIKR